LKLSAAKRSAKRISALILAALTEHKGDMPGKVDSATRLAYLMGLDKSIKIIMEEAKKEDHEAKSNVDLDDKAMG
jgi:hypothetical protein